MDIWIIKDGEKSGPIHDFEVRKKIEAGELNADTPAWHEGLPAWKPLREIDLFQREFEHPIELEFPDPIPDPTDTRQAPGTPASKTPSPVLPDAEGPHSMRRFWARWIDLNLFSMAWWLLMVVAGRDITATLMNPWVMLMHYVPWFVLETFLIHRFGRTPGKWLLGLRVVNNDGSLLSLGEATHRSSRVLFLGIGFGWDIVCLICQIMCFFTARRLGKPLWDHAGGHRVIVTPMKPIRVVSYVFVFFFAMMTKTIVLFPSLMEIGSKNNPELKRQYEEFKQRLESTRSPAAPDKAD